MNYTKKELLVIGGENKEIPEYLYMYSSICSAKKILESSQLWMSSFDKFNDPFEFSFALNNDYTEEEFTKWFCNATKTNNRRIARNLFLDKEKVDNTIKEGIQETLKDYGIKCFTTNHDNLLMWAHYANNHEGVCFKFDIQKDADFFQDLLPVVYDDTYKQLNYIKSQNNTVEILRHKSEAWKYEEEWRVLKLGKANQLVGFSRDSLVQIIFGCRCKDQVEIQKMCSENGFDSVQFSKAEKANDSYKLIVTPLTL